MVKHHNALFDIESNLYCARDYCNIPGSTRVDWWFCRHTCSLISQEQLRRQYGFCSPDEIVESCAYLPFIRVNIVSMEKDYLQKYYPEDVNIADTADPDASFKCLIEKRGGGSHWHNYERNALKAAVEQWCKANRVPYF